ncbi:MAG: hypothetical protein RSF40_04890 [Oscillospiraceae bacterium]
MENKSLKGNYFVCANEVFVEGKSVGQFESFECEDTRENLAASATIRLPFYSMAVKSISKITKGKVKSIGKNILSYVRIDPEKMGVKIGAYVEVKVWYHDNKILHHKFDKQVAFAGFIKNVTAGFPTTIECEDMAFPLRFGTASQFPKLTKLSDMLPAQIEISNEAFSKYREDNGLKYKCPKLSFDTNSLDGEFVFKSYKGISPFDVVSQVLVGIYKLYASVDGDGKLFAGIGTANTQKRTVELDTSINVIGRNVVLGSALFENYKVIVRYIDSNREVKEISKGSENGIPYELPYQPNKDAKWASDIADSTLMGLKARRNKGTIQTLLYPEVRLFDFISYVDTVIDELSGGYYVIGRKLTCDDNGYRQTLTVTNKTFLYLAT